jgi:hypothetical protein
MPTEYAQLVAALKLMDIPFAEYGWRTRPEGAYGVVALDFEAGSLDGDGTKADRSWEGSVDVFYPKLTDRDDIIEGVEETLTEILGNSWFLSSTQFETDSGLFHVEWVFQCVNQPEEPEPEPEPEPDPDGTDEEPDGTDGGEG